MFFDNVMNRKTSFLIILTILPALLLSCKGNPGKDILPGRERYSDGGSYAWKYGIPESRIGYILYDMDRKDVVLSYNRNDTFIPASTTKIPTTVFAMDVLGPDYRFETSLGYTGTIENGVITGNLYIKGGGDPLLTVSDLLAFARKLKEKGIRKVDGSFLYDESELVPVTEIEEIMDDDQSYNPGLSALSLEYNSIFAVWKPALKKGSRKGELEVYLTPSLDINETGISEKKLDENITFNFIQKDGKEGWLLSPEEKKRGRERLPVKNAGLYSATMLARICGLHGIETGKPRKGIMPGNTRIIYRHRGTSLKSITDVILTYSNNMMAELAMLKAAKEVTGKTLGLSESGRVMADYFTKRIPKINWKGFALERGSGLTSRNRISPEQLLGMILYADEIDYDGKKFINFLPSSGWEWSLMSRLNRPESAFHVWAKTGMINYALALSGYLFTSKGKKMAFVIFITDEKLREAYEKDPDRRGDRSKKQVNGWYYTHLNAMDSIVQEWIQNY